MHKGLRMETKELFDEEFVIEGQWTDRQKEVMDSLMKEIKKVLKERFPDFSKDIVLDYHLIEDKMGIKFTTKLSKYFEKYFGELQCLHLLEEFKRDPDATENLLKNLFNNHAVMLYEETIHMMLNKSLKYLVKRAKDESVEQPGDWIDQGMKIIPTSSIPQDVVLMNTDAFEKLKGR